MNRVVVHARPGDGAEPHHAPQRLVGKSDLPAGCGMAGCVPPARELRLDGIRLIQRQPGRARGGRLGNRLPPRVRGFDLVGEREHIHFAGTHFPGRLRSAIVSASQTFGAARGTLGRRTDDDVVREHVSRPGRRLPLAPADRRHRLYGGRLEHPVRLDAVRSRDSEAYGWERAAIQTAFTIFVVVQTWSTPFLGHFIDRYGPRVLVSPWRRADRPGVGHQLAGHHAHRLLRRRGDRRHRRRSHLRDLHQQLVQVVSGPTGPGRGLDRGRLWFRHDPHHPADRQHDRDLRATRTPSLLWRDPGRGDLPFCLVPARAQARGDHVFGESRAEPARLHAGRGAAHACSG